MAGWVFYRVIFKPGKSIRLCLKGSVAPNGHGHNKDEGEGGNRCSSQWAWIVVLISFECVILYIGGGSRKPSTCIKYRMGKVIRRHPARNRGRAEVLR